ncbi:fructose-bisphosphatase class II family protein [Pyrobaculum ferrireducens]|uniref:fructose-bisphosphatase class II family protein n=1 Tax=Pyrobaculum ferrireducens TaxID=1104324 RepID=UPI0011E4F431|nr:fructose-bisphosphatase class II family protein [Pyrobaculum ferrireducens]
MILGEVAGSYVLRDFYTYLLFDVSNPLGDVTIIPPPPGSSYQFAVFGAVVAKMGYRARVLNLPTCRRATISRVLSNAVGEVIYVGYAHRLAYVGPGAVVNPEEPAIENIRRVARGNAQFRVMWEGCLGVDVQPREVVVLGRLPEALGRLEVWLAERFGRR